MFDNFLIHTFHDGNCLQAYKIFGAHLVTENRKKGVRFTTYAPNAKSAEVIGDFNDWGEKPWPMERYFDGGYAYYSELRPGTASKVYNIEGYKWNDKEWVKKRTKNFDRPLNIYEANIGSWKMKRESEGEGDPGEYYTYEELIDLIIPYVKKMGYTHLEVMPLTEFPFDGSWGYQATGFYSATSRYGYPKQLMKFIDACHNEGIGVIMDVVPAHFVKDAHGLHMYDGGFVYDYNDINRRYSPWDSVYFDLGKNEVRSFLLSSIDFFATYYHMDGFRFDAVSNLIYHEGNKNLGENLGAIEWMKRLNGHMSGYHPTVMMIAEDSTDYPGVTKPVGENGLGFDYKWDLGWMNDTLKYFQEDPVYRQYDSKYITFSMAYFYSERFLLEFSHDEVVHGKATIINKMWGLHGDKLAQVKALYVYMFMHPGKKLNFMGNELAEYKEWDESKSIGWEILSYPDHDAFHHLMQKLNQLYLEYPALYELDYDYHGFEWLVVDDHDQCVFAIERKDKKGNAIIAVMNFIGNRHEKYRVPVNIDGSYKEILNTDQNIYSGSNFVNPRAIRAKKTKDEDRTYLINKDHYIDINLAPFSACIFEVKPKTVKAVKQSTKETKKTTKKK